MVVVVVVDVVVGLGGFEIVGVRGSEFSEWSTLEEPRARRQ